MDPFDQAGGAPQDTALARRLHAAGRLPLDALQGLLREARADRPGGLTLGDLLVTRGLLPAAELAGWLGDAPAPLAPDPGATRTSVGPPEGLEDHPDARPEDTALARRLHAAGRLPVDLLRGLLAQVRAARDRDGDSLGDVLVARGHLAEDEMARYSLDGGAGPRPAPAAPGLRLGDYRVLEAIGAGGMGQVHLVEHVTTGARYALKTLPVSARDDLRERFRREAQAMAAVDQHPGVAKVHAFGEAEGQLYYVMDLVTGGDLDARLRARGRLPAREAAALVRDLALALAHVHARGILHRDLKPANVLFDERGRAKVVDFGLARLAGADALTRTGMTLGTPSYMPPEQVEGRRDEVDARSDVYGLGAVLYHALSGQPPFLGPSAMNTLSLVLRERPRPVRELAPDVPAGLEAVCLRALEKRPVDRFCTADDLARALAPFAAGEDAPAPPRRRHLALLAGLALLLVAAGLAARLVSATRCARTWPPAASPRPGPPRARRRRRRALTPSGARPQAAQRAGERSWPTAPRRRGRAPGAARLGRRDPGGAANGDGAAASTRPGRPRARARGQGAGRRGAPAGRPAQQGRRARATCGCLARGHGPRAGARRARGLPAGRPGPARGGRGGARRRPAPGRPAAAGPGPGLGKGRAGERRPDLLLARCALVRPAAPARRSKNVAFRGRQRRPCRRRWTSRSRRSWPATTRARRRLGPPRRRDAARDAGRRRPARRLRAGPGRVGRAR
ncbi:MAG: serine/threonine protein kinase [Planctomycetes bacterium]|nr:serine/threonine protein kinase [Planctomycetota bacterium]